MYRFYQLYSQLIVKVLQGVEEFTNPNLLRSVEDLEVENRQQLADNLLTEICSIPWFHQQRIIDKSKGDAKRALFFVRKTIENKWGRDVLLNFLNTDCMSVQAKPYPISERLFRHCGIDRPIREYNRETGENEYRPVYEKASSKICRATHIDLMRTVQVDMYLAGLHNRGSNAMRHYTEERIANRFGLICAAFGQPLYKVDPELNIIEE